MAYSKYTDQDRYEILNDTEKFIKKHSELSRNQVLTLRRYYRKKGLKMEQELGPNQEPTGRLYKTWEVKAFNHATGEWEEATNHGYSYNQEGQQLSDFISQADPVKINPSRRKPAKRDHDVMVVFSDTQISYMDIHGDGELTPTHDERYINIVRQVCQDYQPEFIVDTSDTVDFSNLSRFPADSPRFNISLNHSINRAHRMYAELRADNPNSKIVSIDSNHTERLAKFLMKQAPELYGLRQAGNESQYGALTYPFLMNFEAIGVDWYGGYRGARYIHGEEYGVPIVFKHGESAVSNGSTAAKESKENPETHVVRGHSHRAELYHRTSRTGNYLTSMVIGCGCDTHGTVPSYHSSVDSNGVPNEYQENWQQSIGLIFDYRDGNYDFNHIMVKDGVGRYNGKEYVADDNKK